MFYHPLGRKKLEGMEGGLMKVFEMEGILQFSVVRGKGTKVSCHPRPMKNIHSPCLSLQILSC